MSNTLIWVLVTAGLIYSVYLSGHLAERRGRSFRVWAWIAVIIGPLALPLVFLFRDLHRKNGDRA